MRLYVLVLVIAAALVPLPAAAAAAACKPVSPESFTRARISEQNLVALKTSNLTSEDVFKSLIETSVPETRGCWSGATGNFDKQLMSAGVAQWNYGQGTLQPLLHAFASKYGTREAAQIQIKSLAPTYGSIIFSPGCLKIKGGVTEECKNNLLRAQFLGGRLKMPFKQEVDNIFESEAMIQVQIDYYIRLMTAVKDDLARLFQETPPTPLQIKWAIDTKVQQGSFPSRDNVGRMRGLLVALPATGRTSSAVGVLKWYEGLCDSVDQEGVRCDCKWNLERWRDKIDMLTSEQLDLLHLTHLRSRVAATDSGRFQASAFQRRAKIIFGIGSVHGRRDDGDSPYFRCPR